METIVFSRFRRLNPEDGKKREKSGPKVRITVQET